MTVSVSKVALVGSACRLPSANGLDEFWQVLSTGQCVITEVDESRFGTRQHVHPNRSTPGRAVTFAAGQLAQPFHFDPGYFGISPREAAAMDPQQRVLLEVVVEALEDAGIPTSALAGEKVGVYVGASSLDYGTNAQLDTAQIEPQSMTGNTLSIIANRISYAFDLRGPSYVVDTACSSSLIALHNAIEDIRLGRVETAVVGGVSLLLHPVPFIGFSRAQMLSENGLCRAFDAGADGYVRSEGAAALILRAEDTAQRNGEEIRGRFVASGTNADGRTAGLSLPSMQAQAALLRDVYETFAIDPNELAFVEAHGTGTRVGDPIEAEAIGRELAQRRNAPLLIGSSKTNFGHLEPASGLVGVLKAQLALANDCLPASLHFETPNPDIRFDALNLTVAREATPLPRGATPRAVGINSFGFGGANAHVVLTDGEPRQAPALTHRTAPLVISAASEAALKTLARQSVAAVEASGDVALYANAAAHTRQRLAHRAVIAPGPLADVTAALKAVADGETSETAIVGEALAAPQKPVFVYSGNGAQWAGMGRTAYQNETDFRLSFDRTDRLFMGVAGWSLVTMLFSEDLDTEIERTEIAQPLLFAIQVAMTEALAKQGLTPAATMGHSVGEVAAAWASGALTLADAVRVIHARSTHQEVTRHLGSMAALLLPADEAREAIAGFAGLELAAINSSRSVTISGPVGALADFAKAARKKRWAVKRLDLDYPFHCALVEPIKEPLLASLKDIAPRKATIPMVSTVTGAVVEGPELTAQYWWDNVRQSVLFSDATRALLPDHRLFLEIGPRPVLTGYLNDAARNAEVKAVVLPSFKQNDATRQPIGNVTRTALAHGATVDEQILFGPKVAPPSLLPHYPWQREHFRTAESSERVRLLARREHVLLGDRHQADEAVWRITHDAKRLPFLADHKVEDAVVFPAAGFAEMLLAAGRILMPGVDIEVRDLDIYAPLVLDDTAEREVRTRQIAPATFVIESRPRLSDDAFMPHVKATVGKAPSRPEAPEPFVLPEGSKTVPAARLYEMTSSFGLPYGPIFRRANTVTLIDGSRAHVRLAPADPATARLGFALDPTLFDSCFHALFAFLAGSMVDEETAVLPIRLGRVILIDGAAPPTEADIVVRTPTEGIAEADFVLRDAAGALVAKVTAVRFQAVPLARNMGGPTVFAAPYLKRITRANEPATVAATLPGALTTDDVTEPSETALLMEAGVQAAAAEVFRPLLTSPASLAELCERGDLARGAVPLATRLLLALEASVRAEEIDGRWHVMGEAIAVDDVVALLSAEHPERLAEAALLAALPTWFAEAFANGLADKLPAADPLINQLLTASLFSEPLHDALLDTVASVLDAAGKSALRLCVVGASNIGFLRRLTGLIDAERVRLVISDRDPATAERLALVFEATPGVEIAEFASLATGGHPFDALFVTPSLATPHLDDLADLMKPEGALFGAAYGPGLFPDALCGLEADWWAGSADPESPIGRLMTVSEWRAALEDARLTPGTVAPLATGETDAIVWSASRAAATAETERPPLPSLHAVGEAARRVLVALSAMQDDQPPVHPLTGVPEGAALIAIDEADPAALPERLTDLGVFLASLGADKRDVTLVTFGAQVAGSNEVRPVAAALSAFGRVAANEFPHLALRLVDVAQSFEPSEAAVRLIAELAQLNAEREIILASDHRAAMRYQPMVPTPRAGGDMTTLAIPHRGSIDHLVWQPAPHPALGADDVRLKVDATGLNFRDVMWTLGLLPHEALQDGFAGPTLGMECSGVIEAVGANVGDLAPGDEVIAFAPACFASHVTVSAAAVAKRPAELSSGAAATVPVAFLTAYYALVELGQLEEDETVLIHGGAGGVGLAALQIAKWRGANVFATAGTVEKRALLKRLGADRVFDSRALAFADEALEATGGEGVDVVLNSLAGEAMERSIGALKPFGRFLELGKRDFYADTKLGLRPFRRNLSYFGIDADQLMKYKPKAAKRILRTIIDLFVSGDLTPLPYREFPAGSVRDAYRLMQSAGHIGKIVVKAPEAPAPRSAPRTVAEPDKAYLLVGGASGFGFATAEWLIGEGARHLVLASRSGVKDEAIAARIEDHRANGVAIDIAPLDVTDAAAVKTLVDGITAERPLGGVFQMAMVLDDALITSLTAERHATAITPKVAGVLALEAATADIDLDLFVVYSSITVQLGNPGQANYVAANAFLEAVARRRRAAGKPGLAVAWGAIADVGVLARDMATSELLQRKLGRHAVTSAEALAGLKALIEDGAMTEGPAVRLVGKVDWAAARKDLVFAQSPAFEDLAEDAGDNADEGAAINLTERLAGLTEQQALTEVTKLLTGEISRILKMPASEIDGHKPLTALGMDSLMGVELRMAAEQRLGIDIPLMSLAAGATLTDLSKRVVQRVRGDEALVGDDAEAAASRHLAKGIDPRGGDVEAIDAAMREKTASMRTIIS
ncbi:MAG: type I polyketide synthase [Acuticoccus sp.]